MFDNPLLSKRAGAALVIVLSAVVLITMLIFVFFASSALNRQVASSSANLFKADNIARLGLETVVADLRSEIVAGSDVTTDNGVAVYVPRTNTSLSPALSANAGLSNVVKISVSGTSFWAGANYLPSPVSPARASAASSTNSSKNGRSISPARWNAPLLMGTSLPSGFRAPDWVLVTRSGALVDGATTPAPAMLADPTPGNSDFVIGRFAYIVYQQGGLLDINVAGSPSSTSTDFRAKRGMLPQVDISGFPGVADANAFIAWRNAATASSGNTFEAHTLGNTNGFTRVAAGDQAFIGRQDLINYAKTNPSILSTNALLLLTTFSRSLNAPSFTPATTRPLVSGGYSASGLDNAYNPSLVNTRVTGNFTRDSDGTPANMGEPLLKHRFPLSRLSLFQEPVSAAAATAIQKYFGLARASSSAPWIYRGVATSILRLSAVAAANREPDFFELLQAAIHVGSLGMDGGSRTVNVTNFDRDIGNQILQIGANIIDQYDADSWPTRITFNGNEFTGIEDIPYLSRVFLAGYRLHNNPNVTTHTQLGLWLLPEVWNPHTPAPSTTGGPTNLRFIATGQCRVKALASDIATGTANPSKDVQSPLQNLSSTSGIDFPAAAYRVPGIPSPSTPGATASGNNSVNDAGNSFFGISLGTVTAPDQTVDPAAPPYAYEWIAFAPQNNPMQFELQYQAPDGTWVTYSRMRNVINAMGGAAHNTTSAFKEGPPSNDPGSNFLSAYFVHSDPRSDRFGGIMSVNRPNVPTPYAVNNTIRTGAARGEEQQTASHSSKWTFTTPDATGSASFGWLSENKPTSTLRYEDPDGTVRRAEGAYSDGNIGHGGYPLAIDNFSVANSRPIILNRPFRSVAELGYASRGMPWKNLDFFTAESGDGALLDVFCLKASGTAGVVAGVVDINSAPQDVLETLLAGVAKTESSSDTISSSDATSLATQLRDQIVNNGPFLYRNELVTRFSGNAMFSSDADRIIKRRRESAVRALADVANLRTWNLLIDVIAQSGRYPASASSLNDFLVEGEKRFWLHIAIDRFSGNIIDQHLEPIHE